MTYQFSVYNFSEQEIEQIVSLAKRWAAGDIWMPIDARKFSKQVKEYALSWALLEWKQDRMHLTAGCVFNPRSYLPPEALWRLVSPMLREDGATGHSIVNSSLWEAHFGVYKQDHKYASQRDLQEKEDILLELSSHHYINFQMAGTVWCIYREEREEVKA